MIPSVSAPTPIRNALIWISPINADTKRAHPDFSNQRRYEARSFGFLQSTPIRSALIWVSSINAVGGKPRINRRAASLASHVDRWFPHEAAIAPHLAAYSYQTKHQMPSNDER
eukprot:gb/GEZJ01005678.1/.p2 GENE.gb/GEZJ01005678.1/~~gb/GEZJ01005678.1/.p2  ORF type:complete len:113 (-),score=11.60 gb/GEZJ01005678.1/:58-396(-)